MEEEFPGEIGASQVACAEAILAVFPDICPQFLSSVTAEKHGNSEIAIAHILDQLEDGNQYPKRPKASLKRAREADDDEVDEAAQMSKRFASEDHRRQCESASGRYISISRCALAECFPRVPCKQLYGLFDENRRSLFATLLAMQEVMDRWDDSERPFDLNKRQRESSRFRDDTMSTALSRAQPGEKEALEELRAARAVIRARQAQKNAAKQRLQEEEANLVAARLDGAAADCECCYTECARNRMVHCNAEVPHFFCRECARRMAETQVGLSKHTLSCMSTDGCAAGYTADQKALFLDDRLRIALERIEQEEALRLAGIEDLETCPFCPFAAEYPEVAINKEFRCQNPDCEIASCRLCRQETHIPQTCEEAARENGHSARRVIEEAMSAALIRNCNKCGTPFIKENGCNKMTCTRSGCGNVQCYVCHKSCDYRHFDDKSRGGKDGNCPLFESVEQRHEEEVQAAEKKAREEVAQANPDVDVELLRINLSDKVKEDERNRRKASDAMHHPYHPRQNALPHHNLFHNQFVDMQGLMGLLDYPLPAAMGLLDYQPPPPPPPPPPLVPPVYPINPPQQADRRQANRNHKRAHQPNQPAACGNQRAPHVPEPPPFEPLQGIVRHLDMARNMERLMLEGPRRFGRMVGFDNADKDRMPAGLNIAPAPGGPPELANAQAAAPPAAPAPIQRARRAVIQPHRLPALLNPVPANGQIGHPPRGSQELPIQIDASPPRHVARELVPPVPLAGPNAMARPDAMVLGPGHNQPIVPPKDRLRSQARRHSRHHQHHQVQHHNHNNHRHNHRNGERPPGR